MLNKRVYNPARRESIHLVDGDVHRQMADGRYEFDDGNFGLGDNLDLSRNMGLSENVCDMRENTRARSVGHHVGLHDQVYVTGYSSSCG